MAALSFSDQISETERRLQLLADGLAEVREQESGALARRVHDELGQSLTAIRFDLAAIIRRLQDREPEIQEQVRKTIQLADEAAQIARSIAADLRPGILDQLGLVPALEWLASGFQKQYGVTPTLSAASETLRASKSQQLALFRIAQEALSNAGCHAHAAAVRLRVEESQDHIVMEICDDGVGIPVEHLREPTTLGLLAMEHRARMAGGECRWESRAGTTVRVTLALPEERSENPDA